MHANNQPAPEVQIIDEIRKTVKLVGKIETYIRVTDPEKKELTSAVASFIDLYRETGRKTSETEICRIALNYLLRDYRENGQGSILARVLAALNA